MVWIRKNLLSKCLTSVKVERQQENILENIYEEVLIIDEDTSPEVLRKYELSSLTDEKRAEFARLYLKSLSMKVERYVPEGSEARGLQNQGLEEYQGSGSASKRSDGR